MSNKAYYDELTGLYNRAYLLDFWPSFTSDHLAQGMWLVATMDIVNFKLINSNFGMAGGDAFLKAVANVAMQYLPTQGYFARIGSNEFAMVVPGWSLDDLENMRMQAFTALRGATEYLPAMPRQRFIIAYTHWQPAQSSIEQALNECAIAIKDAKDKGTIGIVSFNSSLYNRLNLESNLLAQVEPSISNNLFEVVYQGKWSISKQAFCGYEALSRWMDLSGQPISPMVFIPLINKSIYMEDFNRHIVEKSVADFMCIQKSYGHKIVSLSLNISPLFFLSSGFKGFISEVVNKYALSAEQVVLEITEDVFIDDYDLIKSRVKSLTQVGFKISLDDFGSGYSSLSHLNAIDIHEIKVDKSIVRLVRHSLKTKYLFESIIDMATKLQWDLVAEGVETQEELNILASMGCDVIQGYYFAKPQLAKDLVIANTTITQ